MRRERGFTLIELMIVLVVIAIIVAMAIPSLVNARKASYEGSAISSLRTLVTVNAQYRTRFASLTIGYANSFANLQSTGYLDSVLASGTKAGYVFTYTGSRNVWTCTATPITPGTSGDRRFFADQSGVIRVDLTNATAASPPLN